MTDKLKELLAQCKCGLYMQVNPHRDVYETVSDWLENQNEDIEISAEARAEMIRTNTVIDLQFYPNTPIGFYRIIHYDMDTVLDFALSCFEHN